jgi:hypothetical protein
MSRLQDTLLAPGTGYGSALITPAVDVGGSKAGQMGLAADLKGYVSNSAYVRRPLQCFVLNSPRGFNDLPDPDLWHRTFRKLMETGSRTITGLNGTVNVEYVSNEIGPGGEVQEDIAKVTRERSIPVHTFIEKYGMPIHAFFDGWVRYLIGVAETGVAEVTSLYDIGSGPTDLLPDYTAASCLYAEFDPLHRTVVKAFLITNMMPKTSGEYIGDRDITAAGQSTEHSIEFTSIQQVGMGPKLLAQRLWDEISLTGVSTYNREAFISEIDADIKAQNGYAASVREIADERVSQ